MFHVTKSSPTPTACFSVQADASPAVLPRLLELFAKRGLVPSGVHSHCDGDHAGALHVDIQVGGMARDQAEYVARCMRQVVGVELVLTSEKYAAQAVRAEPAA